MEINCSPFLAAVLTAACLFYPSAAQAQTAPIRIMPLGDSITDGSSFDSPDGSGGYRGRLYSLLTTAGYNVDYIGSQTINSSLIPDQNHEGHSGWRIDQLDSNMAGWLASMADPDVVLMHIGTNDFGQNVDTVNAINRLDALILKIATLRPYTHIIVTNLMARGEPQNTNLQNQFNPYVQARVDAHATAGRRVTFLDMRSVVPLSDMPDNLHPNQTGYDKMANAWLPAIQAVIGTEGDNVPPAITRALGNLDRTHVAFTFSKPVADSAATVGNFALSGGLTVSAAMLDASKRVITLTTSEQAPGGNYTATVNGVVDRTAGALALPANTTVNFNTAIPRGYLNHVPESAGYTLAYSLDIPSLANYGASAVPYAVDNRNGIGPFTRVAYYLELQTTNGGLQYVWTSVDAFTTDVEKIGVPTLTSGASFQQGVTGMNVVSNAPGITTGTGLAGQIEFWPTNYTATNSAGVAGASNSFYDFGDQPTTGSYGSMQIHNVGAGQTVFSFNNWAGSGLQGDVDLGIGNDPAPVNSGLDWTFHHNAAGYTVKTLQVLVQTTGDITKPTLASATATFGRAQVIVRFSEPLASASLKSENFSLDGGVSILGMTLAANQREVILLTTSQPAGTPLTLTVSGVRDNSAGANLILPGSTISVAAPALPAEIVANVGAAASGYQLVASIDIPVTGNFNASNSAYTFDERSAPGAFSRVAYYLETQKSGQPVQYVWTSMDAFTINKAKLGIPTLATGAAFQQNVTNLNVLSNVAGVVNGTTAAGGNIEFWPNSYSQANALGVPNASAANYDTGDTRTTTASTGYGCMQVHNHDAGANQTVLALNRFGQDGQALDIGIGNNPAPVSAGVDWTFASNASGYSRRILHVLVLPGTTTDALVIANVPEAANYQLVYSLNLPTTGNLVSGTGFTNYTVNNSADINGFSRVAYYLELQKTGDAQPRFVWTSMDAFTTSASRTGVPTPASGAVFQQPVANMNVVSNVAGVVNGTGIATGNIEFWPTNYTAPVTAGILPGNPGSSTNYDFNDTRATTGTSGSMQVHNYGAAQTLFAINNWGTAANSANTLAMGIGNNPTAGAAPDYTLTNNGTSWDLRRILHVYVLPANSDTTGPIAVSAKGSTTLNRLVVTFNEIVADAAAVPANFSIPGLTVTGAALLGGQKEIAITTSAQTPGAVYTVNVSGVRDRSPSGNPTLPGASTPFTAYTAPAILANIPETNGYKLIQKLAIPTATPQWNLNAIPYSIDESRYGEQLFDRVAYLMELDGNWAYASFDRHTSALSKVGVPTLGVSPTALQQKVTNLNVASNVAGIVTGTNLTGGNIEFWGGDYSAANALGIPNASATLYDFGDTMSSGGGHGCMQIHNHTASQTVLSYTNWGSTGGQTSGLGIGNNPTAGSAGQGGTQAPDWTFTASATNYTTRNLYVLVRPGGSASGTAPVFYSHPVSRTVTTGGATTLTAIISGTGPFTYQWRKNSSPLPGQTSPWLELQNINVTDGGGYDVVVTGANLVSSTSLTGVISVNTPPGFTGYIFSASKNQATTVPSGSILSHASDTDGDTLAISGVSASSTQGGTLALVAGGILYTPAADVTGADSFTITISDGRGGSVTGTVNATLTDGTNPGANQSSLVINGNGTVDVLFYGIPGNSYEIQRSTNLIDWDWQQTISAAADGTLPFHDPTPPAGTAFYRKTP
ncbi:MAG: GDSL-type esterase/lipase family protein [Luteolibacter sp.]